MKYSQYNPETKIIQHYDCYNNDLNSLIKPPIKIKALLLSFITIIISMIFISMVRINISEYIFFAVSIVLLYSLYKTDLYKATCFIGRKLGRNICIGLSEEGDIYICKFKEINKDKCNIKILNKIQKNNYEIKNGIIFDYIISKEKKYIFLKDLKTEIENYNVETTISNI